MDRRELKKRMDSCDMWSLRVGVAAIPVSLASLVPLAFGVKEVFLGLVILSLCLTGLAVMLLGCSVMVSERYWDEWEKEWRR